MGRAAYRWSFEDVAGGVLDERPPYDLIVASFALHLVEASYLYTTLSALARSSRALIILTPHKRPVRGRRTDAPREKRVRSDRIRPPLSDRIRPPLSDRMRPPIVCAQVVDASTGWRLAAKEIVHERVRARLYVSDGARTAETAELT